MVKAIKQELCCWSVSVYVYMCVCVSKYVSVKITDILKRFNVFLFT